MAAPAPVYDSLAASIRVDEGHMPFLRGAFEQAIESQDPHRIFFTGGALLATLYGLTYNRLNQSRGNPEQMEEIVGRIHRATAVLLGED